MARDPGPDFRWGVLSRRSAFNRVTNGDGEIVLFEESTRRQELAVVHEDRARKGLIHHSRLRPFGHTGDWFGLVLPEVKLLHEAAERLDAGEAAFSIAADWTAREIPTTAGRTRWHSDVLRRILLSPRMVGKREYGGTLFDLEGVPPIFDEETWQRVRDALAKRRNHTARLVVHLLSNIALCGNCDRTVLTNTPGRGRGFTYVCRPHFEGDSDACGKVSVVGALAEGRVREEVVAFLADKETVTALLRRHAGGPELDALHDRINVLSESLVALGKALNPPPGVPRMPLPVYYQQATAIEEERGELNRRLAVTREAALLAEVLTSGNPAKEWDARSLEWKRKILNLTTESIVIEPRGKGSVIPGRNAFDPERVKIKFAA